MTVVMVALALLVPTDNSRGGHAKEPPARGGQAVEPSNVQLGQSMAERAGWWGREWRCLYWLWNRESGWQTRDPNPSSAADGIPQANPASKMGEGWESSPSQQIAWGLRYIKGRYGTPCLAYQHSNWYNWY